MMPEYLLPCTACLLAAAAPSVGCHVGIRWALVFSLVNENAECCFTDTCNELQDFQC